MSKTWKCLVVVFVVGVVSASRSFAGEAAAEKKDTPQTPQTQAERAFKKLDTNEDGQLSFDEFKGKRRRPKAVEKAEVIFKIIDTDDDLKISLEEFKKKPAEARFKTLDRNDDGKVTFEEFKGPRKAPEQIERAEQSFKRIDKDGNRQLTLDELKQAAQRARRQGGQRRPDKARILGTWEVVEKNGDADPEEKGNRCIFADGKMTIKVSDGEAFDLRYELDPTKKPKVIDLVIEYEGQTYVLKCVYLLQGNKLTICGAAQPDTPRPTKFEAKAEEQNLYVLRRVRK